MPSIRECISANPLSSRADFSQLVRDLVRPLDSFSSPGGAFVKLGEDAAWFDRKAQWLEGFARPLWGLAPLHAGGGHYEGWERLRAGLANGTDPGHAEYRGALGSGDQRAVEMAAIGFALALAPDAAWSPLPEAARANLTFAATTSLP
ncbi:MAG TPA: DUF2264 domain-containing protein [Ramlibacter sp.]|nr:DUF2264 domain-containing protein [Ramlibacter sp.]